MTWRWPWVSRADLDRRERECLEWSALTRDTINTAEAREAAWSQRYSDLLAKYHALKLQGAVIPEPPAVVVPRADTPVDPIKRVIRDQVRANPDMRGLDAYLTKYAAELRNVHNKKPEDIADLLSRWESSETMSAAVDSVVAVPRPAEDAA